MRNGRFIYLLILTIVVGAYLSTAMYALLILCIVLVVLPVLSLIVSLPGMLKTDIEKTHERFIAKRNHLAALHFKRVSYKSYPSALIKVYYKYIQTICDQKSDYRVFMEEDMVDIVLRRQHVGHVDLTIKKIRCYDLLGIFYKTRKCDKKCSLYVEPNLINIDNNIRQMDIFANESDQYSHHRYGNDYSEIFEIRKYRQGDVLKHMSWRTSLQRQDLYIKVGSQPINKKTLVSILIGNDHSKNDQAFDRFHSLCYKLIQNEIEFDIIYQNQIMANYEIININNFEDYNNALYKMLSYKLNRNQWFTIEMLSYVYGCIYTATDNDIHEEMMGG